MEGPRDRSFGADARRVEAVRRRLRRVLQMTRRAHVADTRFSRLLDEVDPAASRRP